MTDTSGVLRHTEVLELLNDRAGEGSVSAAIALERALRAAPREDEDFDAELERLAGRLNDPE